MSEPRLSGRIAAVTGGGRGLGRAIARALAAEGADIALSYNASRIEAERETRALREAGRQAVAVPADARVPGEMAAFIEEAVEQLGGLDILINNCGVFRRAPIDELSEETLDEAFDVNVKAAVMATQAAAPYLRQRGGGVVVNIASLGGLRAWPSHVAYCTSKSRERTAREDVCRGSPSRGTPCGFNQACVRKPVENPSDLGRGPLG